jgi:hypothetical protein
LLLRGRLSSTVGTSLPACLAPPAGLHRRDEWHGRDGQRQQTRIAEWSPGQRTDQGEDG